MRTHRPLRVLAGVVALAGLLAYLPGLRLLGSVGVGYIPMAQGTAVCFLILSVVLLFRTPSGSDDWRQTALFALCALVAVFGLLELMQPVTGIDADAWIFPQEGLLEAIPIDRMSVLTGAEFVIALHSPLTPDEASEDGLSELKEFSAALPVILVDELVVRRNLPSATASLLDRMRYAHGGL